MHEYSRTENGTGSLVFHIKLWQNRMDNGKSNVIHDELDGGEVRGTIHRNRTKDDLDYCRYIPELNYNNGSILRRRWLLSPMVSEPSIINLWSDSILRGFTISLRM